jgi:hypothetical protein
LKKNRGPGYAAGVASGGKLLLGSCPIIPRLPDTSDCVPKTPSTVDLLLLIVDKNVTLCPAIAVGFGVDEQVSAHSPLSGDLINGSFGWLLL